jgi:hypothetical protein
MSSPTTSKATPNATSSPASEDGPTPSDSRCGLTIDLFGQEVAPASPSQPQEKAKQHTTTATSGPSGKALSALANRQESLANRLKRRLDGVGSTLFTLTWKRKATPLGRPYYQLAASGRRISDNDCGSWATPTALDAKGRTYYGKGDLAVEGQAASFATPNARDWKDCSDHPGQQTTARQAHRFGPTLSGIAVQMARQGRLNPALSLWLMGYPAEWLSCAPQGTQSSRKSRQRS